MATTGEPTFFLPNEKALPAARNDKGFDSGIGGTGLLNISLCMKVDLSSNVKSVEEGSVDEELKRADEEELSLLPPLEAELFVPPLPLKHVSKSQSQA